ncbi:PQQ-binding-like beta-propeller repeat protein [Aggregicoccus sp. 17bor-14]|uniref:outer membrane protein assembly factor BamB family protein n=1 Tax=Myxococcaceae TaxID=31 RepID=UPI00129CF922|nr:MULTISPECIES: PQQ-binding-like beta-propeller repeat protein [Myxococcaceae]MBF5040875.1 PQQ-binding-like beta-propeller repeat protein [Simulacricoccus sp. 17bor-14]MRI86664.1 PQQ-binding-like beta-propeller repeat protein [Aggregicoccus sp. 17bor-14]
MRHASLWKRLCIPVAAAGLMGGCTFGMPLYGNAVTSDTARPPYATFTVDWWKPLVEPRMLEYGPRETARPTLDPDSGRVIAATRDGYVRSVAPGGQVAWEFKTPNRFLAGALVHEGVVYAPGGDGTLYALDAKTGALKWRFASNEALSTPPVYAGGRVLVVSENDTLFAVESASGKWAWQYRRDPPSGFTVRGAGTPVVSGDFAYLGFSDGYLVALAHEDGSVKWEKELSSAGSEFLDVDTTPVLDDKGRLFVASYKDGIFAVDSKNGDVLWNTKTQGITGLVARGEALFATGDDRVSAYHAETGRHLWTTDLGGHAGQTPVFARGMVIVPNEEALLFVDPKTGRKELSWNPGKGVTATPFVAQSQLYVLSNLGGLYALELHGGPG